MKKQEIIDYLLDELREEEEKARAGLGNNYGYIFMICNDLGIIKR